jgi:hypothetical protein
MLQSLIALIQTGPVTPTNRLGALESAPTVRGAAA